MPKVLFFSDLPGEVWKDIPGYEGRYQASSLGRVRNIWCKGRKRLRLMKPRVSPRWGYAYVHLMASDGVSRKVWKVHRAVLFAFVGPPGGKKHARHLNDDKLDNRLANLAWGTAKENSADAYRNKHRKVGVKHRWSKLTEDQVHEIRVRFAAGEGRAPLAREFGITYWGVESVVTRRSWKHVQ